MADGSSKAPELATRSEAVDWLMSLAQSSMELKNGELIFQANIGPSGAALILRYLNDHNPRNGLDAVADKYTRDMASGKWWASYAPLVFEGDDFNCVDGQNRLKGVVRSGVAQVFLVVCYATADAKRGIDIGKNRSITVTHGIDYGVAAACRVVQQLVTGDARFLTREQTAEVATEYGDVIKMVIAHARRRKPTKRAEFIAAFMIGTKHGDAQQREFIETLLEDISTMTHAYDASRTIVRAAEATKSPNGAHARCDEALKILLGIMCHVKGETRQLLRPTTQGLRFFLPMSRYRTDTISQEIGGRRRAEQETK